LVPKYLNRTPFSKVLKLALHFGSVLQSGDEAYLLFLTQLNLMLNTGFMHYAAVTISSYS